MPSDSQQEILFNPCCCITLRTGSIIIGILDIVYGTFYIFRMWYLRSLKEKYPEYFPVPLPAPANSTVMYALLSQDGNYYVMIASGILLLISTLYLTTYFNWLAATCYLWLAIRCLLLITFIIFCNALLTTNQSIFLRLGGEILFCILIQFYFLTVVFMYIRETRLELNNLRAIKPLLIAKQEQSAYLSEKPTKFNNAMSFHVLTPHFFLKSSQGYDEEAITGKKLGMDESMLQYVAATSRVKVQNEWVARINAMKKQRSSLRRTLQSEDDSQSVITLKSISLADTETSVPQSDMSFLPDEDREVELPEFIPPSFMDLSLPEFSAVDFRAGFPTGLFPQSSVSVDWRVSESGPVNLSSISSLRSALSEIEIADVDAPSTEPESTEPEPEPEPIVEPIKPKPPVVKPVKVEKPKPEPIKVEEPPKPIEPEPEPPKPTKVKPARTRPKIPELPPIEDSKSKRTKSVRPDKWGWVGDKRKD